MTPDNTTVEWPAVAEVHALVALSVYHTGKIHPDLTKLLDSVELTGLVRGNEDKDNPYPNKYFPSQ